MKIVDIKKKHNINNITSPQKTYILLSIKLFQQSSIHISSKPTTNYDISINQSTNQTLKTYIPIPLSTITHTPTPLQTSNHAFKRP